MKTYAIKYLELAENHAEKIAKAWAKDVQKMLKQQHIKAWMKKQSFINAFDFIKISARCFLMKRLQMMY